MEPSSSSPDRAGRPVGGDAVRLTLRAPRHDPDLVRHLALRWDVTTRPDPAGGFVIELRDYLLP